VEPIEQVVATLKALGANEVSVLPANYVYRWIHMILIYFDLQHDNPAGNHLFEPLNRIYNERLAPFDYREPCYRYLIAIPTSSRIQIDKLTEVVSKASDETFSASEADQTLAQTFREVDSAAADEIRQLHLTMLKMKEHFEAERGSLTNKHEASLAHSQEISQNNLRQLSAAQELIDLREKQLSSVQELVVLKEKEVRAAQAELDRIQGTIGWRMLSRYGKIKYRYLLSVYQMLGLSRYIQQPPSDVK
jgi:hypothetical protein